MTTETDSIVTTDYVSAIRASPLFCLLCQKASDAMLFYEFEILYHAHMVESTVALIESLEPAARETRAIIAEPHQSVTQQSALLFHECTVLATRQAAGTISPMKSFLFKVVLHRQVADAHAAIHPAGSNQFFMHALFYLLRPDRTDYRAIVRPILCLRDCMPGRSNKV